MIIVISPAKSLDFDREELSTSSTIPVFHNDACKLVERLRKVSKPKLMALMDISDKLATVNLERYLRWEESPTGDKTRQAIVAFDGDVYQGMDVKGWTEEDLSFAQTHLRILSGLYGVLRPLDRIQAHRLEMGTKLKVGRSKDLYTFWGARIAATLKDAVSLTGSEIVVNLASEEYFHSVDLKSLKARVVTPVFMDRKGEEHKIISFWAKKARGKMAAWLIQNRLESPEAMKEVVLWGYQYDPTLSTEDNWIFTREVPLP